MSSVDSRIVTIIAMKGPPFTQKTKIGKFFARSLGCPILSLDCVLDHLSQHSTIQTSNTCPQDLAFDIICNIAHTNLSYPILNNVVIDSPLSSKTHFCRLTKMASSLARPFLVGPRHAQIVIVECKPKNTYLWQMKFEDHLEYDPDWALKWYRPKNWDDVKKAINDDYNVDGSHYLVSKLVVDPYKTFSRSSIMEAVRCMMTLGKCDGHNKVVIFDEWNESRYLSSSLDKNGESVESSKKLIFCENGLHNIFERVDYEANCMACHKQVIIGGETSYACKKCTLVLHKDCAESFDNNNKSWKTSISPRLNFIYGSMFPDRIPCAPCKEDGKDFSTKCAFCLFEAHIRNRLMPTVFKDLNVDDHFLSIVMTPAAVTMSHEVYVCKVCGELGIYDMYMCRICSVACHYQCVILPRRVKQEHGGHYHIMSLMSSSKPDQEDYMCDECLEKRNPELWHYSCEECVFVVHLRCVHKTSYLDDVV